MELYNSNVKCPSSIYAESQLAQTKRHMNNCDIVSNDMLSALMHLTAETAEMGDPKSNSVMQPHETVNRISRVNRIDAGSAAVASGHQDDEDLKLLMDDNHWDSNVLTNEA